MKTKKKKHLISLKLLLRFSLDFSFLFIAFNDIQIKLVT